MPTSKPPRPGSPQSSVVLVLGLELSHLRMHLDHVDIRPPVLAKYRRCPPTSSGHLC